VVLELHGHRICVGGPAVDVRVAEHGAALAPPSAPRPPPRLSASRRCRPADRAGARNRSRRVCA
jgi:hypothetical protein